MRFIMGFIGSVFAGILLISMIGNLATYFGNKIALQILGSSEGQTSFDDLAFPAFPAHPIARRAVPVVETWYRVRDALKI